MRKKHLSYNTGNLQWVAPLYYTQATTVVQYMEPAMSSHLSVLHTNYTCRTIQWTCPRRAPLSTASKLRLSYNIETEWPWLRQNGIWIFRGNARNVPKICFYTGNLLQHWKILNFKYIEFYFAWHNIYFEMLSQFTPNCHFFCMLMHNIWDVKQTYV